MMDQAQALRKLVQRASQDNDSKQAEQKPHTPRVITVTSGKGGVGKSNFTLNFGIMLQEEGMRTLIFDADIGMANIDVLIGSPSSLSLYHVLNGSKRLEEIVQVGPSGIHYVPGGSGFKELHEMPSASLERFLDELSEWSERYDVILFDTGAGLSKETIRFVAAADETFVITTPEPTAIADAYALIKVVHTQFPETSFRIVVNRVIDWSEGKQTSERLISVARRFLQLELPVLGYLHDDPHVMQAVKKQTPFTLLYPNIQVSKQMRQLAKVFLYDQEQQKSTKGISGFIHRWLRRST
ncbi:MinD/ParA family protein [Paenibacillus aquistagni]|uniref:Flagellar biosynthesis protein FlhG n=1 Tax=Paenibacillus aquistagni TaxID=1852522 RepID=A0A1X7IP83_9BACL|nr:MinD/ParA family protein [Paenibacillus aquistagni]NMM51226.1 MinD/ParA family protein [Paenibacillus aquistagni]SMG16470.1 flagellar biosynthesis protein FlhG [Paenibacillus aquistagni]